MLTLLTYLLLDRSEAISLIQLSLIKCMEFLGWSRLAQTETPLCRNSLLLAADEGWREVAETTKVVELVLRGTLRESNPILHLQVVSLTLPVRLHFLSADVLELALSSALLSCGEGHDTEVDDHDDDDKADQLPATK